MKDKKTLVLVSNRIIVGEGQGKVNFQIAKYALANGYRVKLFSRQVEKSLVESGALFYKIKETRLPRIIDSIYFCFCSSRLAKKCSSEIIIANGFSINSKHDLNIAHFVHSGWLRSGYYQPKFNLFSPKSWYYNFYTHINCYFEKISFSRARKIIAVSEMVRDELVSIGIDEKKISMIYNGVDCDEFHPAKKDDRKTLKLAFVGDLKSTRKNLETVLIAIQSIKNVQLLVVGNHENSIYPKLAKKFMADDKVKFLGYSKNIARILRSCDVFVFPSRYDPCPLVIMEAMASGLAVVTSKKVGNWSIADQANAGTIDNPEDYQGLKQALEKLASNHVFREKCQIESRRIALIHDWKFVMKNYLRIIKSL